MPTANNVLTEGGNVFKDAEGNPGTIRINRADVLPTVQWLEQLTGLSLVDNMLGTTGKKETSGDLDLAVDAELVTKDVLVQQLLARGFPKTDIKKTGDSVHLKTPINGDANNGYVQTDFMFGRPDWQRFSMIGSPEGSQFKGVHRHILLASIAKAKGMKWSYKNGLVNRETNEIISQDPTEISRVLLNGSPTDLLSVEAILNKIKNQPDYENLIADAKEAFARDNLTLSEGKVALGTSAWYRQWSNLL